MITRYDTLHYAELTYMYSSGANFTIAHHRTTAMLKTANWWGNFAEASTMCYRNVNTMPTYDAHAVQVPSYSTRHCRSLVS